VKAVAIARVEKPALEDAAKKSPKTSRASHARKLKGPITTARTGLRFGAPPKAGESDKSLEKDAAKRAPRAKVKIDPKLVRAARELRDRYLERINDEPSVLGSHAKYDLTRMLEAAPAKAALTPTLPKPLPQAA
jgi:hypothetical protein